ncbi:hypothetical protein ACPYO6_12285 [Georgenia sp. Z1344]|uniref:hypothetical protein n=1 Tax=Georgenia sp. Z1344 TaxID=3416706 RepID=UPI003CF6659B
MRHGRTLGAGAALVLAAALAACSPVESLDDEETSESQESPSGSSSSEGPAEEETEESSTADDDEGAGSAAEPNGPAEDEPRDSPSDGAGEEPTSEEGDDDAEGEAPAADGERITIEHDAGTVSYALPEGWNDLSFAYEGHPTIVLGAAPLETAANGTQLTLTAIEGGAGSFEAYREALEAQRPPDAEMSEADAITVDGSSVPGLRVEMSTPTGGFVQYTYPIYTDGYQWELQFAMDAGDEEADLPGLRQVAESIDIE